MPLDEERTSVEHEQSVFHGIDRLKAAVEQNPEAQKLLKNISIRTINEIAVNRTYRNQITSKIQMGHKISDTALLVRRIVLSVESELNKKIESAKRSDTRLKRSKEKTIVLNWYRANKEELKKIFDLYNLLIDTKKNMFKS